MSHNTAETEPQTVTASIPGARAPYAAGVPVCGTVQHPDGTVVPRAALTLIDVAGQQIGRGASGEDGRYALSTPGSGSYVLIAAAGGHQPQAVSVTVGERPVELDVVLGGAGRLAGSVLTADGSPVRDATVTLTNVHGEVVAATRSGREGGYVITELVAGEYTLAASAPAFRPAALPVTVQASRETRQDIELAGGAVLKGTVRASGGRAVEDARVTLLDAAGNVVDTLTTGPDGTFRFVDLSSGEYTVIAAGYPPVATVLQVAGVAARNAISNWATRTERGRGAARRSDPAGAIPGLPHIATGRRRTVVGGGTDRLRTAVGERGPGPWTVAAGGTQLPGAGPASSRRAGFRWRWSLSTGPGWCPTGAAARGACSAWPGRTPWAVPRPTCCRSPALSRTTPRHRTPSPRTTDPAPTWSPRSTGTPGTPRPAAPASARPRKASGDERLDVLWWAYPLVGPGPSRLLVLAADATPAARRTRPRRRDRRAGLARLRPPHRTARLRGTSNGGCPTSCPTWAPGLSARIVSQVLELGYPVLEFSRFERVPVQPVLGRAPPARPHPRRSRRTAAAVTGRDPGRRRTGPGVRRRPRAAGVPQRGQLPHRLLPGPGRDHPRGHQRRRTPVRGLPAGTHLRAAVLAGEGFPDGPPDATTVMFRVWVEHNDEPGRWDDTVPVGEALAFPEHTPFYQCMVTGEPVLVPRVTDELSERISGEFEKRDLRPLIGGRSLLIVPLKARNVVLGFMVLMRRPDRPQFDDMDRTTGAELAARAGLVLDNARMYTYQENVADTLQDSMLPRITPRMAGLRRRDPLSAGHPARPDRRRLVRHHQAARLPHRPRGRRRHGGTASTRRR